MAVDQREAITKETVGKDLLCDLRGERIGCVLATVFAGGITVLATVALVFMVRDSAWDPIAVAIFAFLCLGDVFLIASFVVPWYRVLAATKLVKNGDFCIVEDTLVNISEDELARERLFSEEWLVRLLLGRHRIRVEDAFYFSRYGRVAVKGSVCDFSMRGDVFYLVLCPSQSDKVARIYSSKIYRLGEE